MDLAALNALLQTQEVAFNTMLGYAEFQRPEDLRTLLHEHNERMINRVNARYPKKHRAKAGSVGNAQREQDKWATPTRHSSPATAVETPTPTGSAPQVASNTPKYGMFSSVRSRSGGKPIVVNSSDSDSQAEECEDSDGSPDESPKKRKRAATYTSTITRGGGSVRPRPSDMMARRSKPTESKGGFKEADEGSPVSKSAF